MQQFHVSHYYFLICFILTCSRSKIQIKIYLQLSHNYLLVDYSQQKKKKYFFGNTF